MGTGASTRTGSEAAGGDATETHATSTNARVGTRAGLPAWLGALASLIAVAYPVGMAWLLTTADGWRINRLNVDVWLAVLSPFDLHRVVSPEQFAVAMNVALFVPLAWALAVLVPRWWWLAALVGLSCAVESYQWVIGSRQASLGDIASNATGAALGVWLGILTARRYRRRAGAPVGEDAWSPAPGGAPTRGQSPRASAHAPAGSRGDRD